MESVSGPEVPDDGAFDLVCGRSTATIWPSLGGRLAQLDLGDGQILRGPHPRLGWIAWGCYPLLPWSNRLPGGRVHVGGVGHVLPINDPDGTAIHGLAAACPWQIVERDETGAELAVQVAAGPYVVAGALAYRLGADGLRQVLTARNVGDAPVPVGIGIHPWFRSGPVRVPAEQRWPGEPLPTGPPIPVAGDHDLREPVVPGAMDACFTGLTSPEVGAPGARIAWEGPVTNVVVYSGEPGWVCVEPVTMASGGFAWIDEDVPHGVQVLPPGEAIEVAYTWTAGPWS